MEEKFVQKVNEIEAQQDVSTIFSLQAFYTMLLFYWQWFLFSLLVCLGLAYGYLRYSTPIYQSTAKVLIKDSDSGRRGSRNAMAAENLGLISNSTGFDNEMEILRSAFISEDVVRRLNLNVVYYQKHRIKSVLVYKNQPLNVSMDTVALENLKSPVRMQITRDNSGYDVSVVYYAPINLEESEYVTQQEHEVSRHFEKLPAVIKTKVGTLKIERNGSLDLADDITLYVTVTAPKSLAASYAGRLSVEPNSKTTTIAKVSITDESPQRALDFLQELVNSYNRQANEDKNEIAFRTEQFINGRLEKITSELGATDGSIESYKKNNNMIEVEMSAASTAANANEYDKKLIDIDMQITLFNSLSSYMSSNDNMYQVIPTNIGIEDHGATGLISEYNKVALQRISLLRTTNENNPAVKNMTAQLDELRTSIRTTLTQAKKGLDVQRASIMEQYKKYQQDVLSTPGQQRIMTEIGRQQEVQTALYTMLLQKREENSISLAATADKGKLIDQPLFGGKVKPKDTMILLIAIVIGLLIPFVVLCLRALFKYKIENHEDVSAHTNIPIIADIAVATEQVKAKGEIVVHENKNNMMEEIFRSMRTNLNFMLEEGQNVILVTSCIAGEGKTFCSSNLAMSFALLGKKVLLCGMDIRKPRLSELFEMHNHKFGITNLLTMKDPTLDDVRAQIMNSGVNPNLDLMMAGPVPPNPSELLERQQLRDVVSMLRKEYDYIILDSAPVGLVTDTLQFANVADVTLVVLRSDHTPQEMVIMLNDLYEGNKLKNPAIAINGIDMSKKKHSYYYGYGKYGKYSKYSAYGGYGRRYRSYSKYGSYSSYGSYGGYGYYSNSRYSNQRDNSVKV